MLSDSRRKRILDRLQQQGEVRVGDLAREFDVSPMTVQRDLALLERLGQGIRVRGGAVLRDAPQAPGQATVALCTICGHQVAERFAFHLHGRGGTITQACCPHCGLMLVSRLSGQSWFGVTPDTLTGRTVNVREATFVVGSTVTPCCTPSALCFQRREEAQRFQQGFGGEACSFEEAVSWMENRMEYAVEEGAGL